MKKYSTLFFLYFISLFFTLVAQAGTLESLDVKSTSSQTEISFNFNLRTQYSYFYMTNPERVVIDFSNSQALPSILPYKVPNSVISTVRSSQPTRSNMLRLVLDLENKVQARFRNNGNSIIVTVPNKIQKSETATNTNINSNKETISTQIPNINKKADSSSQSKLTQTSTETAAATSQIITAQAGKWIIAIDPGHGGKDPGAVGRVLNIYEKNITLSIAKELKALLDSDPNFKGVLTRSSDYYISVPERSEIARKNKANYLVSIHADASSDTSFKGASIWVLSNQRANTEMGKWLEDHEKQSELLGGAGSVLASHKSEKYLNQTVLDLQFGHSQRVGYELGSTVLRYFSKIASVNKRNPQHASLGVLRSPDIPSILVETGFLSNAEEERQLNNPAYRKKIARAIYDGLRDYRRRYGKSEIIRPSVKSSSSETTHNKKSTVTKVVNSNVIEREKTAVGKNTNSVTTNDDHIPDYHIIQQDETLSAVSRKYNIPVNRLLRINDFTDGYVKAGQKIKLKK